jgi:CubicO group peptidase (beta-lactamase class C family)
LIAPGVRGPESGNPFRAARGVLARAIRDRAFPAAVIEVGRPGEVLWREAFGALTFQPDARPATGDTIFDLASLTKVLATTPLVMMQVERGAIGLDDAIAGYSVPWQQASNLESRIPDPESRHENPESRIPTPGPDRSTVTVRDLLAHCSGLPAWRPYFQALSGREQYEAAIAAEPLEYAPRSKSIYSDLGFMLLGFILDGFRNSLDERFATLLSQMGIVEEIQFNPPALWRDRIAPTENDPWRGRVLVGEVHDENAAALGGIAGHAGLFGTAASVGACARHLLQVLDGLTGAFRRETLETFTTKRADVAGSSRALGWDTMLPTSSCGTRMSPRAFGHTGYAGTSLWIDPDNEVYVVLLTNRVHPTRENTAINAIRPAVHDAVMSELDLSSFRH